MTTIRKYSERLINAMDVKGLNILLTAVKFYKKGDTILTEVLDGMEASQTGFPFRMYPAASRMENV